MCVCVFLNYLALSGNFLGIGDLMLPSSFLLFLCALSSPTVCYRCFSFVTGSPFFCNSLQSRYHFHSSALDWETDQITINITIFKNVLFLSFLTFPLKKMLSPQSCIWTSFEPPVCLPLTCICQWISDLHVLPRTLSPSKERCLPGAHTGKFSHLPACSILDCCFLWHLSLLGIQGVRTSTSDVFFP